MLGKCSSAGGADLDIVRVACGVGMGTERGLWCGLEYRRLDWCRGVPARMRLQDLHRVEQPLLCSLSLDGP